MKQIIFPVLVILLFSCKKDNAAQTNTSILMGHTWYPYQVHLISYDTTTNFVLKDTTYITTLCDQQSTYQFLPDSIVKRPLICQGNVLKEGKWYASEDSLKASIMTTQLVGTVYFPVEEGITAARLLEINQSYFIIKETKYSTPLASIYGFMHPGRNEVYTTFRSL